MKSPAEAGAMDTRAWPLTVAVPEGLALLCDDDRLALGPEVVPRMLGLLDVHGVEATAAHELVRRAGLGVVGAAVEVGAAAQGVSRGPTSGRAHL